MKTASCVIAWTLSSSALDSFLQRPDGWGIEDELQVFDPDHDGVYRMKLSLPEGDDRRRRFVMWLRQEPDVWHVEFKPRVSVVKRHRRAHHAIR